MCVMPDSELLFRQHSPSDQVYFIDEIEDSLAVKLVLPPLCIGSTRMEKNVYLQGEILSF